MNSQTVPPTEDPKGTIAWRIEQVRIALMNIEKSNLTDRPEHIPQFIGPMIEKLQAVDTLAAQLLGAESKRKDPDQCSPEQASSSQPSSRSPSFADS